MLLDPTRPVGHESRKAYARRCASGFWVRWIRGPNVIDIGYRGGLADAVPLVDTALGIELGTQGYDGLHLPVRDGWADTVHCSHLLEHVEPSEAYLREWFRALRVGGTLILMVPHCWLYERRFSVPPSRWSGEHLRAYTPMSLLLEIEAALAPNTYRVRHLADNDTNYDYALSPNVHPSGEFEIECVLEKVVPPRWAIEP